jgi:hypothetical protein
MAETGHGNEQQTAMEPRGPKWATSPAGKYYRLVHLDPTKAGLKGVPAVSVIWHSGVRSRWVYVSRIKNPAASVEIISDNDDIMQYEVNGGLFITWSLVREKMQLGVIEYLTSVLESLVASPKGSVKRVTPVPVLMPGIKP